MQILKFIGIGALLLAVIVALLVILFAVTICIAIGIEDRKISKKNYDNIGQIRKESGSNEY